LDKRSFKSAISSLPLGYSDAEIDKLFDKNKKEVLEG
jgi:Ca2+-binding EF-hand superfamily protein